MPRAAQERKLDSVQQPPTKKIKDNRELDNSSERSLLARMGGDDKPSGAGPSKINALKAPKQLTIKGAAQKKIRDRFGQS